MNKGLTAQLLVWYQTVGVHNCYFSGLLNLVHNFICGWSCYITSSCGLYSDGRCHSYKSVEDVCISIT